MSLSIFTQMLDAYITWAIDHNYTPLIMVNAEISGVVVPRSSVRGGIITLNVTPSAVANFNMTADQITFAARFNGKSFNVIVPLSALLGVYCRETTTVKSLPAINISQASASGNKPAWIWAVVGYFPDAILDYNEKKEETSKPSFLSVVK